MKVVYLKSRWLFKYLIFLPVIVIVVLNINFIVNIRDQNGIHNRGGPNEIHKEIEKIQKEIRIVHMKRVNISKQLHHYANSTYLEDLRKIINEKNENPSILNKHSLDGLLETNADKFKSNATKFNYKLPTFLVILVQVHSRLNYLKELIESLRTTKFIEETLVIFSHDLFDLRMNKLIEEIDFCATLQIFYPQSNQLNPDTFPGEDPRDCPKSIGKAKALMSKCQNAAHPDTFGNYRESKVVQIKHHWLWKLSFVFEKLRETKNLDNLHVLLLEDDYYLMPDSIHVLRKLSEFILSDIDVVSLGIFEKRHKQSIEMDSLNVYSKAIWHSSYHNTGLLLSRVHWNMLKACSNVIMGKKSPKT